MAYSGGILCYIYQDSVRILDVHGASGTEDVIDMKALVVELSGHHLESRTGIGRMQSYQNGILRIRLNLPLGDRYYRIDAMIDVRRRSVSTMIPPVPVTPMVITDGRYLVCAFWRFHIEGYDDDIAHEATRWTLKCYDLDNPESSASIIALSEFLKGHRCLFKLFGGWLYAICCEDGFSITGPDGARRLYYSYCRFPIDDFRPAGTWKPGDLSTHSPYSPLPARLETVRLFRGFAEDDRGQEIIDLVQDERTGNVFIVELGGGRLPNNTKSLQFPQIIFLDPPAHTVNSPDTRISEVVQIIDEYPCSSVEAGHRLPRYPPQDYERRIHTKPSQSFMDVTYDDCMAKPIRQTLHLSAGSRVPGPPIAPVTNFLYKEEAITEHNKFFIEETMFSGPPRGAPQAISEVLRAFPPAHTGGVTIHCHADERSLIIIVPQPNYSYERDRRRRIILVNFDSGIHFPGLKPLTLDRHSDKISYEAHERGTSKEGCDRDQIKLNEPGPKDAECLRQLKQIKLGGNQQEEASESSTTTRRDETPRSPPWFYTEPAMHLEIGKGLQFHR